MKRHSVIVIVMAASAAAGSVNAAAPEVRRTPFATAYSAVSVPPGAAQIVSVNNLVFPAAVYGSNPDALKQVEEVVETMHAVLATRGLGIGNMLQHTIFMKDGAASTMDVLDRFHATATRLAPSLKQQRSVGTIIRVPEFPDKNAAIMLDMVAGTPLTNGTPADGYVRVPFTFGPQEIAESVGDDQMVFTAGLEAMDFEHGTLPPSIDEQIVAIVGKLNAATKAAGLSVGQMVQHNLYVANGTDPARVVERFHQEARRYSPELKQRPSVGAVFVVNGMAAPGFLLEMDAVVSRQKPETLSRVLWSEVSLDVAKTVAVGDLVYVGAMPGEDFSHDRAIAKSIDQQIETAVKNVQIALQSSGLSLANMVKHRIVMKKGAADPTQVRAKFYESAARYAPELAANPSAETFLVVEGFSSAERLFEVSVVAARK